MPLSETILLLTALLALGIIAAGLVRKAPIPYTVVLVIIGVGVGELSRRWALLAPIQELSLTPELVLFVFLPVLIFESGLKLDARQLIKDIVPVLTLAIPALLISTVIIGTGMWLVLPIKLTTALLFGALISATDPVAVVALFKELGTPQRLTILVEGESLMNDATAIVLFNILLGMALFGGGSFADVLPAVGEFIVVFAGGALVGAIFGIIASIIIIRFALGANMAMTLLMVTAYGAFVLSEHYFHLSGVMSVAVCAIMLGIFGLPKLTANITNALYEIWDFLALQANTLLFILVGFSVNIADLISHFDTILIAVLLILLSRAGIIYGLMPLAVKGFNLPQISIGEKHIMWWGGLKGGLAIAIVLSIPNELPGKNLLLDLTLGVVMFTLMVNAPTIKPLINRLGINRLSEQEEEELQEGAKLVKESTRQTLTRLSAAGVLSRGNLFRVEQQIDRALAEPKTKLVRENNMRYGRIRLLRAEMKELDALYQEGVVQQYTYLDIKGELRRKRDHVIGGIPSATKSIKARRANLFLRLEDSLVSSLREHDFAAGLLAHYQNIRLSHHLVKDVAHILMTKTALNLLPQLDFLDEDQRRSIQKSYNDRLSWFSQNINTTRQNFPEFYKRFESRLSCRAALAGALAKLDEEHQHGGIGAKAFAHIEQQIEKEIDQIPPITAPVPELDNSTLVGMVPLFKGMPNDILKEIADQAHVVTFLVDDTVIGEGDHGNALYIVVKGQIGVFHINDSGGEMQLAVLGAGDFVGETALLGDSVRTATVRALEECTLLRITRKTIATVSNEYPALEERLEEAHQAREKGEH